MFGGAGLSHGLLEAGGVHLLDTAKMLFVWVGSGCSKEVPTPFDQHQGLTRV